MSNKNYTITGSPSYINYLASEYAFIGLDFVRTETSITQLATPPQKPVIKPVRRSR